MPWLCDAGFCRVKTVINCTMRLVQRDGPVHAVLGRTVHVLPCPLHTTHAETSRRKLRPFSTHVIDDVRREETDKNLRSLLQAAAAARDVALMSPASATASDFLCCATVLIGRSMCIARPSFCLRVCLSRTGS